LPLFEKEEQMPLAESREFVDRRFETFDPEDLVEVIRDGRFYHRLLHGGNFAVRHRRLLFGNSSLDCGDYAPAFAVSGQFSPDQLCIGFTPRVPEPGWCNGFVVNQGEVLCFTEGTELQFRNAPDTSWQVLLIDRLQLQQVAVILLGRPADIPDIGTVKIRAHEAVGRLTSVVGAVLSYLENQGPGSLAGAAVPGLTEELVNAFVRSITSEEKLSHNSRESFAGHRYAALRRAEQFLRETMDGPFSSRGLCSAARMSERSVEMLFKDAYGMAPRTWSRIARLNAARQDLIKGDIDEVRVSNVAVRWGFYHFGRFSAYYRHLFGESPSATVARRYRRTRGSPPRGLTSLFG
jgi:AraC-like DNA-binding protein